MTSLNLPSKIILSDDVLFQEVGEETILLNMQTEQYFGLNFVGTRIWQLLSSDGDAEKALQVLSQEYKADETTLRTDLELLLHELADKKLISIEN